MLRGRAARLRLGLLDRQAELVDLGLRGKLPREQLLGALQVDASLGQAAVRGIDVGGRGGDLQRLLLGVERHQRLAAVHVASDLDQACHDLAAGAEPEPAFIAGSNLAGVDGAHGARRPAGDQGPDRSDLLVGLGSIGVAAA